MGGLSTTNTLEKRLLKRKERDAREKKCKDNELNNVIFGIRHDRSLSQH
jgi:hypothetical protein